MRSLKWQPTIVVGNEPLPKRFLRVAGDARHLHLPTVRVAVARRAVTRQPQIALLAIRQHLRLGVFVTRRALEPDVGTAEIEADDLVVELAWIRHARLSKRQAVHQLELTAMVLAVASRTRSRLAIRERTMQAVAILDLLVDLFVALVARSLHVAKPATVACRTRLAATEFGQPSMHRRDGSR